MGRELNLGRYSLRDPAKSQEIRVGSFYRKQKANKTHDNTEALDTVDAVDDWGHRSKRFASESSQSVAERNVRDSLISDPSTSFESSNADASSFGFTDNSTSSAQIYQHGYHAAQEDSLSSRSPGLEKTQMTSAKLIIDTQGAENTQILQATENTHESYCVKLNPDDYSAHSASNCSHNFLGSLYEDNCELSNPSDTNLSFARNPRKKVYPKRLPYKKIMSHVVFVMSGIENPRRAILRDMAIAMGAKYSAKWNKDCTHLL